MKYIIVWNERYGIYKLGCFIENLFRLTTKKTPTLHNRDLVWGESAGRFIKKGQSIILMPMTQSKKTSHAVNEISLKINHLKFYWYHPGFTELNMIFSVASFMRNSMSPLKKGRIHSRWYSVVPLLLGFVRTRVLMSRSRLNNGATHGGWHFDIHRDFDTRGR